jgi:hypothetical protein
MLKCAPNSSLTTSESNKSTACACVIPRGVRSLHQSRWQHTNTTRPVSSKSATRSKGSSARYSRYATPGHSLSNVSEDASLPHDTLRCSRRTFPHLSSLCATQTVITVALHVHSLSNQQMCTNFWKNPHKPQGGQLIMQSVSMYEYLKEGMFSI